MASDKMRKGRDAENLVCSHLQAFGCEIIARNFRKRFGELDIVALEKASGTLCFVEVRSAAKKSAFLRYSIGPQKRRSLLAAMAAFFFERRALRGNPRRFDVAWVVESRVEHWKNVELALHFRP